MLCTSLFSQSFTGSVNGHVSDASGSAVGGAVVLVTDRERGTSFRALSDGAGRFVVTALPPGNYMLTVESPGFKKFASEGFTIAVQE